MGQPNKVEQIASATLARTHLSVRGLEVGLSVDAGYKENGFW